MARRLWISFKRPGMSFKQKIRSWKILKYRWSSTREKETRSSINSLIRPFSDTFHITTKGTNFLH